MSRTQQEILERIPERVDAIYMKDVVREAVLTDCECVVCEKLRSAAVAESLEDQSTRYTTAIARGLAIRIVAAVVVAMVILTIVATLALEYDWWHRVFGAD